MSVLRNRFRIAKAKIDYYEFMPILTEPTGVLEQDLHDVIAELAGNFTTQVLGKCVAKAAGREAVGLLIYRFDQDSNPRGAATAADVIEHRGNPEKHQR